MRGNAGLSAWLRLAAVPGVGGETQRRLLKACGLPEAIFAATHTALAAIVGEQVALRLLSYDAAVEVETALTWADLPGNRILTLADADYPAPLLDSDDPPPLLYAKGRVELLRQPALAVVGSRNASRQGEQNAEAFAEALSRSGLAVVSGLALGIDAAAHRGALRGAGGTIAVIGTGVDRIYPARNEALTREIAERGVIVSEFALGTPPLAANFPRRNRIIAGLAKGCLVVEAAPRSGSLITARLAAEAGREVFAIPGSIHSPLSKGCHALIKQGAKLVESAEDILEELGWTPANSGLGTPAEVACGWADPALDGDGGQNVLAALGYDPCTLDGLVDRTGLTADTLLAMLLVLELDGRVAQLPGGLYQQIK
ncbi:MAG: DNA-processing protein DprA [Rhodocyclaceae bacterium]|jgi:DNA processing protein|nr:DNA-processing protein DprA [Rhodocyclaceae bacterium]